MRREPVSDAAFAMHPVSHLLCPTDVICLVNNCTRIRYNMSPSSSGRFQCMHSKAN
ncbi:hypothetical protein VPHK567_0386 [Vibrio phage K567]